MKKMTRAQIDEQEDKAKAEMERVFVQSIKEQGFRMNISGPIAKYPAYARAYDIANTKANEAHRKLRPNYSEIEIVD